MTPEHQAIFGCIRQERLLADDLFGALPPRTMRSLNEITSSVHAEEGKFVITQGDPSRILVLIDGRADAMLFNLLNERTFTHRILNNEIVGLPETIRNSYSTMSVKTVSRCRFDVIDRNGLLRLLSNEPEICYRVVEKFSFDLREAYSSMNKALRREKVNWVTSYLDNARYVM